MRQRKVGFLPLSVLLLTIGLISAPAAQAQCVRAALKGKSVKLSVVPTSFSGQCPAGTVPMLAGAQGGVGPQGPQGPAGATGPQGPRGPSAFDTIPSGTTVTGVIGGYGISTSGLFSESLPAPAPAPLDEAHVIVRGNTVLVSACGTVNCLHANEQGNQQFCNGTSSHPSAAPGFLCIYPTALLAPGGVKAQSVTAEGVYGDSGWSNAGFTVYYQTNSGGSAFQAVWAYTAP